MGRFAPVGRRSMRWEEHLWRASRLRGWARLCLRVVKNGFDPSENEVVEGDSETSVFVTNVRIVITIQVTARND